MISGPPPLGPGAPALDRLLAFGESRLERNLVSGDLMVAAAGRHGRSCPRSPSSCAHVRYLLGELDVTGDLPVLALSLLAPLDVTFVLPQLEAGVTRERILATWTDLVRRVVDAG